MSQDTEEEIKKLTAEVRKLDIAYDEGKPLMSDQDYDVIWTRLKDLLEQENKPVLSLTDVNADGRKLVHHPYFEGSLGKTQPTDDNLRTFLEKWNRGDKFQTDDFVVETKEDGSSMIMYFNYFDGRDFVAATRGGGTVGIDVTELIEATDDFSTIKANVKKLIGNKRFIVRAEAIIEDATFDKISATLPEDERPARARNQVAGIFNGKNVDRVKSWHPQLRAYNIENAEEIFKGKFTETDMLDLLSKIGFHTADLLFKSSNIDKIEHFVRNFSDDDRNKISRTIDGLVIKANRQDNRQEIGYNEHHPYNAIAYKFEAEFSTGVLDKVVWQESAYGTMTPIAVLRDPVNLGGSTVSRASLATMKNIHDRDIKIGDEVIMRLSNDVIPQITSIIESSRDGNEQDIVIPDGTHMEGEYVVSDNVSENQLLQRWNNFVTKPHMNIDGASSGTIKKMVDANLIDINDFSSIYLINKDDFIKVQGLGLKKFETISTGLKNSKSVGLARVLLILPIKHFGTKFADFIAKEIGDFSEILDMDNNQLLFKIAELEDVVESSKGFGKANISTMKALFEEQNLETLKNLQNEGVSLKYLNNEVEVTNDTLNNQSFAVTGRTETKRKDLVNLIETNGGKFADKVNKDTTFLITNTPDSGSAKNKTAEKLGVKLITEDEFKSMIE